MYNDSGRTTVWNATNTVSYTAASKATTGLTLYGRVPQGQDVPVGSYSDTVQATITF
jgi:spore coat protein U-like protein